MTLSAWDMADLDRLASETADVGNRTAREAFTAFALRNQWVWTPAWLEARAAFATMRRKHRAAFLATQVAA